MSLTISNSYIIRNVWKRTCQYNKLATEKLINMRKEQQRRKTVCSSILLFANPPALPTHIQIRRYISPSINLSPLGSLPIITMLTSTEVHVFLNTFLLIKNSSNHPIYRFCYCSSSSTDYNLDISSVIGDIIN